MSDVSKKALDMAYNAGHALPSVQWSAVEDVVSEEKRALGAHHCPFSADQAEEREAWLKGLADALDKPVNHANLVQNIRDEIKVASRAK